MLAPALRPVVVVTGANRGIGLATVGALAARLPPHGVVFLCARDAAKGAEAAAALRSELARDAAGGSPPCAVRVFAPLDVADAASVARFAAALGADEAAADGVDVLVNNAGVKPDADDADAARRALEVNAFGAARVTSALLPLLALRGGRVVNVGSRAAVSYTHLTLPTKRIV